MKNHKLAIAAICSLVFMVPQLGSYFVDAGIIWDLRRSSAPRASDRRWMLGVGDGTTGIVFGEYTGGPIPVDSTWSKYGPLSWGCAYSPMEWPTFRASLKGFEWRTTSMKTGTVSSTQFNRLVPSWSVILLCSIAPALWLRRWRKRTTKPTPGLCPTCGYDLRATPGRCPECGMMIGE